MLSPPCPSCAQRSQIEPGDLILYCDCGQWSAIIEEPCDCTAATMPWCEECRGQGYTLFAEEIERSDA